MIVAIVMLLVGLVFDRCGSCYDRGNCDAPFLEWCLIDVGVVMIEAIVMLIV